MMTPVNMNSGTAMSTCLVIAPKATCMSVDQGRLSPQIAVMELPSPKTINIGTDVTSIRNENAIAATFIYFLVP